MRLLKAVYYLVVVVAVSGLLVFCGLCRKTNNIMKFSSRPRGEMNIHDY